MTNFWGAPGGFMERRREKPGPARPAAAVGVQPAVFEMANCRTDCDWDEQGLLWVPKKPLKDNQMSPVKNAMYETPSAKASASIKYNYDVVCSAMTSESEPLLSCTYCTHACILGNEKILARTIQTATVGAYCNCAQQGAGNPGTSWYDEAVQSVTDFRDMAGELTAYV
eukprot:CAMPEP_0178991884 /NCGR_PEP_ID=MMETSP0795-20121207/5788_1 /TAXON_ID=88552 /ORGANISM="Amoebophrya sp., Strain Ameob2" /LENGTH=168 /DNA_ID=CAMNT_0020683667 /DNA_START=474 /DNA_END=980 /DNA_ORIENTATION=-